MVYRLPNVLRRLESAAARWAWTALLAGKNIMSAQPVTGMSEYTVNLTSYGSRITRCFVAIESIGRGAVKPRRLILWLDEDSALAEPPRSLRRLASRGLEIKRCENLGPHKKYYPFISSGGPAEGFVTADDDVIYPSWWLAEMIAVARRNPRTIVCHRARRMEVVDGRFAPYRTWPLCTSASPSFAIMPTGVGGVLYPKEVFIPLLEAGSGFIGAAPRADDIWLHRVALGSSIRFRQVKSVPADFPRIPGSQSTALWISNAEEGGPNDEVLMSLYSKDDIRLIG